MSQSSNFPRGPAVRGIIDATGMPALVLFASMVGYGSMAREYGLGLWSAVASTGLIWGLPGQIAMVELYALGAPLIAVVIAVSAANARFLPMVLSVMPLLGEGMRRKRWLYVFAQFLSLNPWAAMLRRGPGMNPADRAPYYTGFALVCIGSALIGTGSGFLLSGVLSREVILSLVFLNPVFFTLVFVDARGRGPLLAVLLGVIAGPAFHTVSPDWGLIATGIVAGGAAYAADRVWRGRHG